MEEVIARNYILKDNVDLIINVVDASNLERSLYLTIQLLELGKKVIIALNMMDIINERGIKIDINKLSRILNVYVIPVSAIKKDGLDLLIDKVIKIYNDEINTKKENHNYNIKYDDYIFDNYNRNKKRKKNNNINKINNIVIKYSFDIEQKITIIEEKLYEKYKDIKNLRWYAIKYLEADIEIIKKYPIIYKDIIFKSYEEKLNYERYLYLDNVINDVLYMKNSKKGLTDKIDKVLTNNILGIIIFLVIMAIVFALTFILGNFIKDIFQNFLTYFSSIANYILDSTKTSKIVKSLILDGIISGVGGVLTFIPNIFILFILLAILEDSGYMSRVAYIMNNKMEKLGLSGRAFVPMILGFGCTVPAIMASRVLENKKDRLKTILITPFMSCSAKIPIYILFSGMFFGKYAFVVSFSMYLIGICVAFFVAKVISIINRTEKTENALLIELPEYKRPNFNNIKIYVFQKIKDYLIHAGTTILIASIFIWIMLNFNFNGYTGDIKNSFGLIIGDKFINVMKFAGLGYSEIILALISGIAGKEVVISTLSIIYGIENINSTYGINELFQNLNFIGFNSLNTISLMIFVLLYIPCIASLATIYRETKSKSYLIIEIIFQLFIAWSISTLVYQVGSIFIK